VRIPERINLTEPEAIIDEIAAGDCHALAKVGNKIYAWGQGLLLSPTEDEESQEVICNMPITLGGGYENLMIINTNVESNQSSEKRQEELFHNSFKRLSSILKNSPNKTEEKKDS
jgi:hypothetical protein